MNDPKYLRAETHPGRASPRPGAPSPSSPRRTSCARLLGATGWRAPCFSSESAGETTGRSTGSTMPSAWPAGRCRRSTAPALSRVRVRGRRQADGDDAAGLIYLSTTDYVQHKHAPGTAGRERLLSHDGRLSRAARRAGRHGGPHRGSRHERRRPTPPVARKVVYLQDVLDGWLGAGRARVILPITDPYVVHHGALGSFATVYLPGGTSAGDRLGGSRALPGMELVLDAGTACRRFELPADRMGDVVVGVAARDWRDRDQRRPSTISPGSTRRSARTAGSPSSACRSW